MIPKNKCKFCNGKKVASFLSASQTPVYFGHEKEMQRQLDENDMGKLERKPCPECAYKPTKAEKVILKKIKNNDKPIRAGKKPAKKNHS